MAEKALSKTHFQRTVAEGEPEMDQWRRKVCGLEKVVISGLPRGSEL